MKKPPRITAPGVPFEGSLFRIISKYLNDPLVGLIHGFPIPTRFAPEGVPCLYASQDQKTALAEISKGFRETLKEHGDVSLNLGEFVTVSIAARLSNVLDLTRPDMLQALNLKHEDIVGPDNSQTQTLGRAVSVSGEFEAIRYPSPVRKGFTNVCIFRVFPGSTLEVFRVGEVNEASGSIGRRVS